MAEVHRQIQVQLEDVVSVCTAVVVCLVCLHVFVKSVDMDTLICRIESFIWI